MLKPLYQVTRNHHLNHLNRITPFIFAVFCFQCFAMNSVFEQNMTPWFMAMASSICFLLSFFYLYDTKHSVEIFPNSIVMDWSPFFGKKILYFSQIKNVEIADESESFSHLKISLDSGKSVTLFFIDDAAQVKHMIERQSFDAQQFKEAA